MTLSRPHYLLTGAGFSYNWGGWLASEAFEYLLGEKMIDADMRQLLWDTKERGGGFEDALAVLQKEHADRPHDIVATQRLGTFIKALVGMLDLMSAGMEKQPFEPDRGFRRGGFDYSVSALLRKFDAIFTLNQDTLLEHQFYNNVNFLSPHLHDRWEGHGFDYPGTQQIDIGSGSLTAPRTPVDPANFRLKDKAQPYFKLHGSRNYQAGAGHIVIMGGNKAGEIPRIPLLAWYHSEFLRLLSLPDSRLMVIGYSFSDEHINATLLKATATGLKLFIVDPAGIDVIDKRPQLGLRGPNALIAGLRPHIIGASRRPLLTTFGDDAVEWTKVMTFFS